MTKLTDGERAARRQRIEAAIANYPDIKRDQLDDLLHWFRKEASALDVALLASNHDIHDRYRRFSADHLEGLSRRDLTIGMSLVASLAAVIAVIVWLSA